MRETLVFGLCLALLFCYAGGAEAGEAVAVGGPAVVTLDFRINFPPILYLQVGSASVTVDLVTFDVANIPGSGAVAQTPATPVPVRVAALVGANTAVALTADSSTALSNGPNTIPFSEISWTGAGSFAGNTFSGTNNQLLDTFVGPGNRTGTYSFRYANNNYYSAGTYNGTVTYTLSVL